MGSSYPNSIDTPATLYSPVDAFSTKPLDTTTTTIVLVGDSTISVSSTSGGFAATYGILSIDDELIVYTAKTGTQFTGCQRGAFGTTAAQHALGAAVLANMVSGFITALQSAVLAIETELGTAAARNYVLKDGAVTITGLKTFQDGAEFGSGNNASTGLVRLPNTGAVKWRKADDSGDLGMALNASDHVAMDAIIDFAAGQTFGAFSYPDATTTSKGIVQVDPVGGLAVAAGVASLAVTGVVAGTYSKVTVDVKGRVTGATTLVSGDLPAHAHAESDVTGLVTDLAAKAAKAGDTFTGTLRIGGDQAYLECRPYQTVGGAFENMAKYSEDFSAATWDKNGGSCSVTANSTAAPDGNQTADTIAADTTTPIIQQQIAGLASGGLYTFYVWAKAASGTKQVSIAIVDNAYAGYLAGPTSITLTTAWQRFKITGTLAGGHTGLAVGTVAVAQLAPDVFARLGDKRQHRLIALLAFVLRVVALAPAHLLPVQGVHSGVGVDGDDLQLHVGRLPDAFAHGSHEGQNLAGDIAMQRVHEPPEGGLYRQFGDFEDARQDRIAGDEAQLVEPRKADVETEHDTQHKSIQVHGPRNPLRSHGLFHQGLESELLQQGDHRQQPAIGRQILTVEVIGCGGIDSIGFRNNITNPLIGGPSAAILFLFVNHLGGS